MKKEIDRLIKLAKKRGASISQIMDAFEHLLIETNDLLKKKVIDKFLETLDVKDGKIQNTNSNLTKISNLDKLWDSFAKSDAMKVINFLSENLQTVKQNNFKYFSDVIQDKPDFAATERILNRRIGIDEKGQLVRDGYLDSLAKDKTIRNDLKRIVSNDIMAEKSLTNTKKELTKYAKGDKNEIGVYERYMKTYAYDSFVQNDRLASVLNARSLGLTYFIYQGTRRESSRHFCIPKKGKVFNIEQSEQWKELIDVIEEIDGTNVKIGPLVGEKSQSTNQKKENYIPLIDMGGYNCVDIPAFISDNVGKFLMSQQN